MDTVVTDLTSLDHPALAAAGPRMPCPDLAQLAEQLPQYEFHELLGGGATGWVYQARQKSLDRWVAVKLLPNLPVDRSDAVARFQQEAQILAKLNHARIVTVFDYGVTDDARYLVMELVAGPTLREEIIAAPFEPAAAIRVIDEVCEAIELAHSRGITHRDLKPENVIFESSERTSHIKVADFGISRLVGQVSHPVISTRTSLVLGTPYYVAPEQMQNRVAPDHRADIFAIGVMLYELLTGQLPMGRFARPSRISRAPPAVDAVVMRCLESNPSRRFSDVASLRRALSAAGRRAVFSARRVGLVACAAIVLASTLWGVKVALTRTAGEVAQSKAKDAAPGPRAAVADSKSIEENATAPKQAERPDAIAGHPEPSSEKAPKPEAAKQLSENDVFISSVQATGRYPRETEFQLECHLKNPELATTKDSRLVYVVRSQQGRKLESPLSFPEGRRDITVHNNITIHPMDRWPLEFFIEEQWQKPSPGTRRASNVFRVEWYEVPMTGGF
jgi:serine/threonine protein kinase